MSRDRLHVVLDHYGVLVVEKVVYHMHTPQKAQIDLPGLTHIIFVRPM